MKPRIFETPADLFQAAADEFANRAAEAIKNHGRFCVAFPAVQPHVVCSRCWLAEHFPTFPGTRRFCSGATNATSLPTLLTATIE